MNEQQPRVCLYCNADISHKGTSAKYCNELHRNYHFKKEQRKNKSLAGTETELFPNSQVQQPKPLPQVNTQQLNQISSKLNSSDHLVFNLLMGQNKELKDDLKSVQKDHAVTLKELNSKIDQLNTEKKNLEKELSDCQRQLSDKPKGLSGFLEQNPETVKTTILEGLPMVVELVKSFTATGGNQQLPPFVQFLYKRPEEEQQKFMAIMKTIMANEGAEFTAHLETLTRSLMSLAGGQQQQQRQVTGAGRY